MRVTIEGVVNSDVLGRGERRGPIENTAYVQGLIKNRIVRVVEQHPDEPEPVKKSRRRRAADDQP